MVSIVLMIGLCFVYIALNKISLGITLLLLRFWGVEKDKREVVEEIFDPLFFSFFLLVMLIVSFYSKL